MRTPQREHSVTSSPWGERRSRRAATPTASPLQPRTWGGRGADVSSRSCEPGPPPRCGGACGARGSPCAGVSSLCGQPWLQPTGGTAGAAYANPCADASSLCGRGERHEQTPRAGELRRGGRACSAPTYADGAAYAGGRTLTATSHCPGAYTATSPSLAARMNRCPTVESSSLPRANLTPSAWSSTPTGVVTRTTAQSDSDRSRSHMPSTHPADVTPSGQPSGK